MGTFQNPLLLKVLRHGYNLSQCLIYTIQQKYDSISDGQIQLHESMY